MGFKFVKIYLTSIGKSLNEALREKMRIYLTFLSLFFVGVTYAQQIPGTIIDAALPAANPMDPNGDGFITSTGAAFTGPIDESEFEIPFLPIAQYQNEPVDDNQILTGCQIYDLVNDAANNAESSYYYYKDPDGIPDNGDELLLFRFRLARFSPGSTSYSILMDLDNKFGFSGPESDPNAIPGNLGFEKEIAAYTSTGTTGGVRVFNVDGVATATVINNYYPLDSHYQMASALNQDPGCSTRVPTFVDMYVPFSTLGISSSTPFRLAVAVNEAIGSSLGGGASDIGGINGNLIPNDDNQFIAAINNFTTISIGSGTNRAPSGVNGTVALNENLSNATSVHTVSASDPNADVLSYSIVAGNVGKAFAINTSSGAITVNNSVALNFETNPVFTLIVRVSDGSLFDGVTITIKLLNVNEPPAASNATVWLNENSIIGEAVHSLVASDPDAGAVLNYSIIGGNTGTAFAINSSSGVITVNNSASLDFETISSYTFTVRVSDGSLFNDAVVTINLNNVNESPKAADAAVSLNENSINGAAVHNIVASDPDAGAILGYSITAGNTGTAFVINSISGAITVSNSASLDFETTPLFTLTVRVSDGSLFAAAAISVNLANINEAPAIIDTAIILNDAAKNGAIVYTVLAKDPDINDVLSFSIESGNTNALFAIQSNTGIISINDSEQLKFVSREFDLKVMATDQQGLSGRGLIRITLINIPDVSNIHPLKGFSPNGDGINDFWLIEGIDDFPENTVKVFNRWGMLVYESSGYDNFQVAWRGEGSGQKDSRVIESTYFYIIHAGDFEPLTGYLIVKQ